VNDTLLLAAEAVPKWGQWVLGAAALVTAFGILWTKVLNPVRKAGNRAEEMLPLLVDLTETFKDTPAAFLILDQIIAQFRTDSGSSLRDVVNRLEQQNLEAAAASLTVATQARELAVGVEAARQLAVRDREELARLFLQLDRVTVKVDSALLTIAAIQSAATGVAFDLTKAQAAVDGVAADLADAHARADATGGMPPGAAADAALSSGASEATQVAAVEAGARKP